MKLHECVDCRPYIDAQNNPYTTVLCSDVLLFLVLCVLSFVDLLLYICTDVTTYTAPFGLCLATNEVCMVAMYIM